MSPLTRHQVTLDVGGPNAVTVEVDAFEWPRSAWEVLELRASRDTHILTATLDKLQALYNGAHGQVFAGLAGLIVQYVENTGGPAFTVEDWRGNTGTFAFLPDNGLEVAELPGSASEEDPLGSARHVVTMRLAPVA